ncbi:SHOCT domain-containing protein [Actinomadura barringtoniae]|uniref:SHOCT domain-containing protein n=1 Tax=Actinomadura barringtoniae TaxID=1427535 RepID=A0A939T1V2_9ACTN|nr:SHOCT domain-containing protein [Actinomadura barringtoniae]MBO2448341.1 SHOCT domain-containing protein [Actinomadura barringtoniae]
MPGLLRGVARTAIIAGTASAVNGRVQRRQAEKFAGRDAQIYADRQAAYDQQTGYQQQAAPAAQPAQPVQAAPPSDPIERLKSLAELKDKGVLTEEEFAAQKARILAE